MDTLWSLLFSPVQTITHLLKPAFFCYLGYQSSRPLLHFASDGTFQLSIFEDLHYGEAENLWWGPQQDINSTRVMNSILDVEKQQLVVLNGDLITGENTFRHNSTDYVDKIVQPLLERSLPWASTYGNHDSQFNLSPRNILKREQSWRNALTQQMVHGPASGVSNYYLPVYPSSSSPPLFPWRKPPTPSLLLWFFDSRGGNAYNNLTSSSSFSSSSSSDKPIPQPDWVDSSVVNWFRATQTSLRLRHGRATPSLAFVHIPVKAALAFQMSGSPSGVDPRREPGIDDDRPLAAQGEKGEGKGGEGEDVPFMRALLESEGLLAVFSGHDHGDDWCFRWEGRLPGMNLTGNGLDVCFGRRSGYGGYGEWVRGSRQVLVSEEGLRANEVETWVRLESGEVTGRVTLNGTFGSDRYPVVTR